MQLIMLTDGPLVENSPYMLTLRVPLPGYS